MVPANLFMILKWLFHVGFFPFDLAFFLFLFCFWVVMERVVSGIFVRVLCMFVEGGWGSEDACRMTGVEVVSSFSIN